MPHAFPSLPTIYRNFLHFFRMSFTSTAQWCEIPAESTCIESYCDRLGVQCILDGSGRMNAFYVEKVDFYRTHETSQHEYLAAKVRGPNNLLFYLAFERRRGEIAVSIAEDNASSQPVTPSASAGSSLSVASLNSLTCPRKAVDKVTLLSASGKYNDNDQLECTLQFPLSSSSLPTLPLYQLVVLAKTVHDARQKCLLFSENCYWYAGTIVTVMQDFFPATAEMGLEKKKSERWGKKGKKKAGTWNGVKTYAEERSNLSELREMFKVALERFRVPVSFSCPLVFEAN